MNPKVSIIILNWNSWEDTIECLESLNQINYDNYDIILIDNGSSDNSIEKIKEYCNANIKVESNFVKYNHYNKPIKFVYYREKENNQLEIIGNGSNELNSNKNLIIIENRKNYGFTKGNNIGMEYSKNFFNPKYYLLLNNDTGG